MWTTDSGDPLSEKRQRFLMTMRKTFPYMGKWPISLIRDMAMAMHVKFELQLVGTKRILKMEIIESRVTLRYLISGSGFPELYDDNIKEELDDLKATVNIGREDFQVRLGELFSESNEIAQELQGT